MEGEDLICGGVELRSGLEQRPSGYHVLSGIYCKKYG